MGELRDPVAWLYRVALNRCSDYRRIIARGTRLTERLKNTGTGLWVEPHLARTELALTFSALPRRQRTAATLYYLADMSTEEVARVMGVSQGTVDRPPLSGTRSTQIKHGGPIMNRPVSDTELRDVVRRLAPAIDESSFHGELGEKCAAKTRRRRRGRHVRAWAVGVAVVALLVAGGFGVNALVERMGQDKGIVVITDETMSPGGTGQGPPDPAGTQGTTLTGAKAELWAEIQRIREGVKSGTVSFGWTASEAAGGDLPSDPMLMLDSLEESLLRPDATVYYLRGSAGDATALRTEVSAMPGVTRVEFVSKDDALERLKDDFADNPEILEGLQDNPLPASLEIWLTDYTQAPSLADELRGRPEVDEVVLAPTMDYAQWVERLRSLTSLLRPDVTVYLRDSAGDAAALQSEISAMPGVTRLEFVSKDQALQKLKETFADNPEILEGLQGNPLPASLEIWLSDHTQAASLAEELRSRPEVDEVLAPSATETGSGPVTTYGVAPSTGAASATTPPTAETVQEPRLNWGEAAALEGRTIRVSEPMEDPQATGSRPDLKVVYSMVTITNTGSEPLTYVASEFFLEGNSGGSTGIAGQPTTVGGQPVLARGMLAPGETVTAAVRFNLKTNDVPVKVRLGTATSTAVTLASWQ